MIVSKNVTLRPLERTDLEKIAEWRNRPDTHARFFSYRFIPRSNQEQWYRSLIDSKEKILFAIEDSSSKEPIGTIGFDNIDFKNQQAEFGNMLIGEESYLGKGYAKEASLALIRYGFRELNLNRIYLRVLQSNSRATGLYKKCGFEIEGTLREAHFSQGTFQNILMMSLLRREFTFE